MSRHGYIEDDGEPESMLSHGRWRAQVASALRGKRGQTFLVDLIAALDALPEPKLVAGHLETTEGEVCALGALGRYRQVKLPAPEDPEDADPEEEADWYWLGSAFDIAPQLAQETMYVNDEHSPCVTTPAGYLAFGNEYAQGPLEHPDAARWRAVRRWAIRKLTPETLVALAEEPKGKEE